MLTQNGVNALSRANAISTVPSGNPLLMRVPSSVFASNSQNILKISVFQSFFGLIFFLSLPINNFQLYYTHSLSNWQHLIDRMQNKLT